MQMTSCLPLLLNQSGAESCQLVSSLSAYERLYFGLELFESDLLLQFLFYLVYSQSLNKITFLTAFLTSSLDSANSAFNRKVPPLPSSRISPKVKKPFVIKNLYVKPNREENCVKQTKASHRDQILAKK